MSHSQDLLSGIDVRRLAAIPSFTDEEFAKSREVYDRLPYPAHTMSDSDKERLKQLLPNLRMEFVEDCEVKCRGGVCACGRPITLLDIVTAGLKGSVHSAAFIESIFNGDRGKVVMCAAHADEEVKRTLPPNTILISQDTLTPCVNCGRLHEVALSQQFSLYIWILN